MKNFKKLLLISYFFQHLSVFASDHSQNTLVKGTPPVVGSIIVALILLTVYGVIGYVVYNLFKIKKSCADPQKCCPESDLL